LATDPALGDFSGFSFVGGDFPGGSIFGNPESTFIVECPEGLVCDDGVYPYPVTIPEDTVQCPYCDSLEGEPIYLQVPCNGGVIEKTLPPGTSDIEINRTIFDMMRECGQTLANQTRPVGTAGIATLYSNAKIDPVECDAEDPLKLFSGPPGGLFVFDNTAKTAYLPSGALTSYEGQEVADAKATEYVTTQLAKFIEDGGQCGYWNTEQTVECLDETEKTVPAKTYFSATSQAAADQLALDDAEAQCPASCDVWFDDLVWVGSGVGTTTGAGPYVSVEQTSGAPYSASASKVNPGPVLNCTVRVSGTLVGAVGSVRIAIGGSLFDVAVAPAETGPYDKTFSKSWPVGAPVQTSVQLLASSGTTATVFIGV
jgi:hypothetical protein